MWRRYESDFFWWELVEIVRKLVLTLILVLFMEGSASQIVFTMLVSFVALLLLAAYRPYRADDDDSTAIVAQVGLVLTTFANLLLKVDVTGEDGWDRQAFDAVLVMTIIFVPLFAIAEVIREYFLLKQRRPACCVRASKTAAISPGVVAHETSPQPPRRVNSAASPRMPHFLDFRA